MTLHHLLLIAFGGSIGLLTGFIWAWIVVDRDYHQHQQRLVRGEAHQPLLGRDDAGQTYEIWID